MKKDAFFSELGPRALQIFISVVNAGSMSAGASILGISQAAVSQQISKIERAMGQPVFYRKGGKLTLTQSGTQLRFHALKILEVAREAEQAMQRYSSALVPTIRCGIMETMGDVLGPGVLEVLQPLADDIEIASSPNYDLNVKLTEGRFDLVITTDEAPDGLTRWSEVAVEPGVLIVPKGYFSQEPDIDALAAQLPMAKLISQRKLARQIDQYLRSVVMGVERRFSFDRASMTIDFVARGAGWTIATPFSLLHSHVPAGLIDVYPLPGAGFTRKILLGSRGNQLLSIPDLVLSRCRSDLRRRVDADISRIAPKALPMIQIRG